MLHSPKPEPFIPIIDFKISFSRVAAGHYSIFPLSTPQEDTYGVV